MLVLLAACVQDFGTVQMTGTVHDAPGSGGNLVAGAALAVTDAEQAVVDEVATNADGSFSIGTPAGQPFFLELAGEGWVPTNFSGTAGMTDFAAGDGYPWIATPAYLDGLRDTFSACPDAAAEGGVVAGEVRLYVAGISSAEALPPVDTARVAVYTPEGEEALDACYLDDNGESVADAEDSGPDGMFAVFGVPAGSIAVELIFTDSDQMNPSVLYSFVMSDGGFVPLYPALVYEGTL